MATSQPLVCASLHLPPDPQPFLRVHQISWQVFLPNLDRLRLALEENQGADPEAAESFFESRKVLRDELQKVFKVLQFGQEVADRYYKVLNALEEKKPTQRLLYEVCLGAHMGMRRSNEAQQAISEFRRELEKVIKRVTATTGTNDKRGHTSSLTSAQNIQLVSEIFTAIEECNGLLRQCHDQFAQLETQTEDENSIDSNPPSEEETKLIRAKWQTYFDSVVGVWIQGFRIADEILYPTSTGPKNPSRNREARQDVPLWRTLFQRQDKRDLVRSTNVPEVAVEPSVPGAATVTPSGSHELRTNDISPVPVDAAERPEASENAADSNAAVSNGPKSNNLRTPFWRKIFRRTNDDKSTLPRDVSGEPQANDGVPDVSVPPRNVTFWRRFFRYLTLSITTSLNQI